MSARAAWPALPLESWRETRATLHLWTQIVGKVRLAFSPHVNHWWETPFYVTARGLTTSPIPHGDGAFEARFDFAAHELRLEASWGPSASLALRPLAVADFYAEFLETLRGLGVETRIWPVPVEIPNPIPFEKDRVHAAYDREAARRFWQALVAIDGAFKEFRAGFLGKDSPVHFFWGSFDLAVTRFSGRRAPERPGADKVTREAYSHEVISAGWWPGDPGVSDAAFYCYAAPEPPGFREARVGPRAAFYDGKLKEFLLPYEAVRTAPDPRAALRAFLEGAYGAAADLGRWDRAALDAPRGPWPWTAPGPRPQ